MRLFLLILLLVPVAAFAADGLGPAPGSTATTDASALISGTLPDGRFPATLPAASGANLTALNAGALASGTVAAARLPASVALVGRVAVSNAAASIAATTTYAAQTGTMTSARAWTLPAANAVAAGWSVDVVDESGTVSWWHSVNVTPAGADTVNGLGSASPTPITLPYAGMRLVSNGVSAWTARRIVSARPDVWVIESDAFAPASSGLMGDIFTGVLSGGVIDTVVTGLIDAAHPGCIRMRGNSAATDRVSIIGGSSSQIRLGGGVWRQEWLVDVPTLSTAAQEYVLYIGYGDQTATALDEQDGVYFLYDRTVGVNWQCKTASNNTRTIVDSGTAVAAATFVKLGIEINAAATSCSFFIDGVIVPTAGMPITTNIPTGAGREMGFAARFQKTVGTTATAGLEIDRFRQLFMSTTPR